MKFDSNVLQVNTHRLTESDFRVDFQDGGHDIISGRNVQPPKHSSKYEASAGAYAVRQFIIIFIIIYLSKVSSVMRRPQSVSACL